MTETLDGPNAKPDGDEGGWVNELKAVNDDPYVCHWSNDNGQINFHLNNYIYLSFNDCTHAHEWLTSVLKMFLEEIENESLEKIEGEP